jgi:hypothetical protein
MYMLSGKYRRRVVTKRDKDWRCELRFARLKWPGLPVWQLKVLKQLLRENRFSVRLGDIIQIENHWYVTNSGLLKLAVRRGCIGISTRLEEQFSDATAARWVFSATVCKSSRSRGFVAFGDADPSNVSTMVHGAELRVAETRAINRALRRAYGIGLCSLEERDSYCEIPAHAPRKESKHNADFATNSQARLRDRLLLLVREHNLNPTLVKAYAADFCGTGTLGGASRELVESFISHLAVSAKEKREALICKLNSYSQQGGRP